MQKGNSLHPFGLHPVSPFPVGFAVVLRTRRLMAGRLRRAMITTTAAVSARAF
jgi:hypothetical protein